MATSSASAAPAHRARVWPCQSVRAHLVAGGVIASVGIIAGALVAVPPAANHVRSEVRSVRLAAVPVPRIAPSAGVVLPRLTGVDPRSGVSVVELVAVDPADITAGVVTTPKAGPTTQLTRNAVTNPQAVDASALAAPTAALSIPGPLLPILGPIILFAPIIALGLLILPLNLPAVITFYVQSTILFVTDFLSGAAFAASPLAVAASPSATIDGSVSGPVSLAAATARDAARVAETGEPEASAPETFSNARNNAVPINAEAAPATGTGAVEVEEPSIEPAAAGEPAGSSEPAPSADVATSEPESVKVTERRATPRPVVRESFKVGERLRKRTAAADDGAKPIESSPASKPESNTASKPGETSPAAKPSPHGGSADRGSDGEGDNP